MQQGDQARAAQSFFFERQENFFIIMLKKQEISISKHQRQDIYK